VIRINRPRLLEDGPDVVVTSKLSGLEQKGSLRFRLPAEYAPTPEAMADAMLPIGLMLSMATDQTLELESPVSAKLLQSSATVQDIFHSWYPKKLKRVEVHADSRSHAPLQKDRLTLSTFTAGVDAFFTLDKHFDEVSSLLYVYGFDTPLKDKKLRARMSHHLNEAADHAGKTLIEGACNARRFLNPHLSWSKMSHGATISSFAILLSSHHELFYFPASYAYADLYPWGSHPLVDPLWSTEYLKVIHDGAEASRVEKTRTIAHNPSAQKHLRICFMKRGDYNCGTCSKCLRTKMALELEGRLDKFETLDNEIDLDELKRLGITSQSDLIFARENYDFALERGHEPIAGTLREMIDEYQAKAALKA